MKTGQSVRGTYCGAAFSGVISDMRPLTVRTDGCIEYMVKLDAPIVVFGESRDSLCVYARWDGKPSSYTKHQDALEAA